MRTPFARAAGAACLVVVVTAGAGADGPTGCTFPLPPGIYTNATFPIVQAAADGSPVARTYHVLVPPAAEELPVVFDLHGGGNVGLTQQLGSEMLQQGLDEGFVVVQPNSLPNRSWITYPGQEAQLGYSDVDFLRRIVDVLRANFCIDDEAIYATGFSSGALLSTRLACRAAMGDLGALRIAAIAPVAYGPLPPAPSGFRPSFEALGDPVCPALAADPVPMRMIASSNDLELATDWSVSGAEMADGFRRMARAWALDNGCAFEPDVTLTGLTGTGVLEETRDFDCPARADTILDLFGVSSPVANGHFWPGRTDGQYQATEVIWDFFAANPR